MKTFIIATFSAIRFFVVNGYQASSAHRHLLTGRVAVLLLMIYAGFATAQTSGTITTVAGKPPFNNVSFGGDGGPAIDAFMENPYAVTSDASGNIYISDTVNMRVRKVTPNGIINTIAGNGTAAHAGDGGLAINASINQPRGIAVDSRGNVYVAEYGSHRIRRIGTDGIITTFAGTGTLGFSGDGGQAASARVFSPYGLAIDSSDNLYIADTQNSRIRRVSASGIISTVAGSANPGFSGDGGLATSAGLNSPRHVTVDAAGNIYFSDAGNRRVRRVSAAGIISTIAGNNTFNDAGDGAQATLARLERPGGVAVDRAGQVYIADTEDHRIRRVATNGIISTVAGNRIPNFSGDGGLAINAQVRFPEGMHIDASGNLLIADTSNSRIRKITLPFVPAPVVALSRRGGIDLDGQGSSAVVLRATSNNQLTAGRLVNNVFQWTNLPDPGADFRLIAPVDIAGNGKSDLPMLRETPLNSSGQGSAQYWPDFSGAAPVLLREVKPAWDVQAVGDLDGDSFGDLVWRFRGQSPNIDDQGVSYIWFSNGAGLSQVRKRGGAPLTWTLLGAADLNGDSAADMLYLSPDNGVVAGSNIRVLMATPNRTCANLSGGAIPGGFKALKLADFTAQGRGDILVRNAVTGEVRLIGLNATGLTLPPYAGAPDDPNASCTSSTLVVTQTNFNIGTADPSWTLYVTGDFNGDGVYDIAWRRPDNTLTLWLMAANGAAPTIVNNAGIAPANASALPLQ
jgi:sugar lactone lactonase YvrE